MRRAAVLLAALWAFCAAPAGAAGPGTLESFTAASGQHFLLYTPSTYDPRVPAPLYVMTHGCNTRAAEQAAANGHHAVAERERFLVLYPDNDDALHPLSCWRFYEPSNQRRDAGDPAIIAGMTREAMAMRTVDRERVYLAGMSSGAFMASNTAAAYPDLYAAVGIMAGGAYGAGTCIGAGPLPGSTDGLAVAAHDAMGPRARVMPFIVLHGDSDTTVPPGCGDQAVQQWLRTNSLAAGRELATRPAATHPTPATADGRYAYDVSAYRDAEGCLVGEHWLIRGMGHFWSGGTHDPRYAEFTDPLGPNAAEATWAFFERFRRDGTAPPCTEATVPAPPTPPARRTCRIEVHPERGRRLRAVVVTQDGRRLKVTRDRRGRARVVVVLRGTRAARLITRGRTAAGRRVVLRRTIRPCAR